MTEAPKKQFKDAKSPKGIAVFPRLNEPDFKFNANGRFSVKLKLPRAEAEAFLAQFKEMDEKNFDAVIEATKNDVDKKTLKPLPQPTNDGLPFAMDIDKTTKEPTGFVLVSFSANAKYKDKKTGKMVDAKVGLYDSKGTPANIQIGGGSTIKVAFTAFPYYNEATRKAGISFRMRGVQVINLVKFGGVQFDAEEGGYEAQPEDSYTPKANTEGAGSATDASKGDF